MISVVTRVYNDVWHLYNSINGIYAIADEIIIIEGAYQRVLEKGIKGYETPRSSDGTLSVIDRLIHEDTENKIKVVYANERDIIEQISVVWSVTSVKVGDWLLVVDSDEIYTSQDAIKIKDFILSEPPSSLLKVDSYNFISKREYRSDSGYMNMGGRIHKIGCFCTDRLPGGSGDVQIPIPGVKCFHYSLYKPPAFFTYKTAFRPEVSNHWIYDGKKVKFVDGTSIIYYGGDLPKGYA